MGILTSRGYNLQTPGSGMGDISQGYQLGMGMQDAYRKNTIADLEFDIRRKELGAQKAFTEGGGIGQEGAIKNAFAAGSKFQTEVARGLGLIDQRTGRIDSKRMAAAGQFAVTASSADYETQNKMIHQRINDIKNSGGDSSDTEDLLSMTREERAQPLKTLGLTSLPPEQIGKIIMGQQKGVAQQTPLQRAQTELTREKIATSKAKRSGVGGGAEGAFAGKGMPAQISNALVKGANNPAYRNSPAYHRAWDMANKPQIIDTEEGRIPLYPEISPIFKPPGPSKPVKNQVIDIKKAAEEDVKVIKGTEKKKTTADEKLSAGFLNRMTAAEGNIVALGNFDSANWWEKFKGLTNVTASPEMQNYTQAADDWIRSKLRRESGAVIAPEEMAKEYEIYFPQLGDAQPVINQKKKARAEAINSMTIAAGRAGRIGGATDNTALSSEEQEELRALRLKHGR